MNSSLIDVNPFSFLLECCLVAPKGDKGRLKLSKNSLKPLLAYPFAWGHLELRKNLKILDKIALVNNLIYVLWFHLQLQA